MDWSNTEYRKAKRGLSKLDKQTLPTHSGHGLILPGEPNTEVEELIDAGYHPRCIFAVEQNQQLADTLYEHYWDKVSVYWEEVGAFLRKSSNKFSYVHLDYTGHLKETELLSIESTIGHLAPMTRLRISIVESRRQENQLEFEASLREDLISRLGLQASNYLDTVDWAECIDEMQIDDITQLLTALVFVNHCLGMSFAQFRQTGLDSLPPVQGEHIIGNLQRFKYSETNNHSRMVTAWWDLYPIPHDLRNDSVWLASEVAKIFRLIGYPAPTFNPDSYRES